MSMQIKQYEVSEMYKNGQRTHFDENAATYDGRTLSVYQNVDGITNFHKLSNREMERLLQRVPVRNKVSLQKRLLKDFPKKTKSKSRSKRRSKRRSHRSKRRSHRSKRRSQSFKASKSSFKTSKSSFKTYFDQKTKINGYYSKYSQNDLLGKYIR